MLSINEVKYVMCADLSAFHSKAIAHRLCFIEMDVFVCAFTGSSGNLLLYNSSSIVRHPNSIE